MKCPHCGKEINVGALLGSVTSRAKAAAVRENGKLGGRPKGSKNKKPKRPRDSFALAHSVVADAIKRTEQSPETRANRPSRKAPRRDPSGPLPSPE